MTSKLLRALAALLATATLAGCHARWNPLGSAPTYKFRSQSVDGTFNRVMDGVLTDEDAGYASGFKYEVPAPGSMIITAKPANASVQLDISVFADGSVPIATTKDQPDKKLQVQDLQPGTHFIVVSESWKEAQKTRFKLTAVYKPADPDAANGPYKSQAGARELSPDKGMVSDTVNYSEMRRTNFWKIILQGEGELAIKFNKEQNAKLTAELVPPSGAPEKIDPVVGYKKADLPAGDYFVKVTADDAGDAGQYTLSTTFKAGDTCKNGGPACAVEGAEELKLPTDTKQADVDFTKSKQFHFYKLTLKEKGKFNVNFKILAPPRGSKVTAWFMRRADDEGEKITGTSFMRPLEAGEYFIRVQAMEPGDVGKYALATIFQPDNFIAGEMVELGKTPCMLTVNAGTNQGVRAGVMATILGPGGAVVDTGVVDQAFPNLSKVRPLNPGCRIPNTGVKVQIAAQ